MDFISINGLPFAVSCIKNLYKTEVDAKAGFDEVRGVDIIKHYYQIGVAFTDKDFTLVSFDTEKERDEALSRINKQLTE